MRAESEGEWPSKLQPAVFAANTKVKKATGFTPSKLMFGRDTQSENLLNMTKSDSDDINIWEDTKSVDDYQNQSEQIVTFVKMSEGETKEWNCENIERQKSADLDLAKKNIEKEQLRQNRIYDRKVIHNRYIRVVVSSNNFTDICRSKITEGELMLVHT